MSGTHSEITVTQDLEMISAKLSKLKDSVVRWNSIKWIASLVVLAAVVVSFFWFAPTVSLYAQRALLPLVVIAVIAHVNHLQARFLLLAVTVQEVFNGNLPTYIVSTPKWIKVHTDEDE